MKKIIIGAFVAAVLLTQAASAASQKMLIIFDASGSMLENFGGDSRINVAKSAVSDVLASLDSSIEVGYRPFGHIKKADKTAACLTSELAVPFTTNRDSVRTAVTATQAVGTYTPTAYALTQAKNDFLPGDKNAIVLLTDGKETCGGNTAAAAKALLDAGINVKTYVIGLGLDAAARAELSAVAAAGGGKYFDATDATSLAASFAAITKEEGAIDKTNTDASRGTAVRGGNGYDTAVEITPGRYHLDHDQKYKDVDYFKMSVTAGTPITFKVVTDQTGVYFDPNSNTFKELIEDGKFLDFHSKGSYFTHIVGALQIFDTDRTLVKDGGLFVSGKSSKKEITYTPDTTGVVYVLVGGDNGYSSSHGDIAKNVLFTIGLKENTTNGTVTSGTQNNQSTDTGTLNPTQNTTPVTQETFNPGEKNSFFVSYFGYIIIGAGLLALLVFIGIILLIVFLVRRGNKNQPQPVQMMQQPMQTGQMNTPNQTNIPPQQ